MSTFKATWLNSDGVTTEVFNQEAFRVDPLGYLDVLRKGEEMIDLHITDSEGNDVTSKCL